jgi:predicted phage terminase large subunit-like protein
MPASPSSLLRQAAQLTPAQLAKLPPSQLAALQALVRRAEREREPLFDFVVRTSPKFTRPRHLAPVARLLERARAGEQIRALVFAPPRHGKSECFLHAIPWWLEARPADTVAYITYGAQFSEAQARKARGYAAANGWVPHPKFDTLGEWRNPEFGGCVATGLDGAVLGKGFHLLLVDDPHKNRPEAESPRMRAEVLEFFDGTLVQRMEPGGSIIVTHQRWHDEDLIGTLKARGGWEVVELPALNAAGEPLWPERYGVEDLALLRKGNEYNWWSQYMGSPRPRGGAVFKREPVRFEGSGKDGRRIVLSVDGAGTESTRADYTVGLALAVTGHGPKMTGNVVDVVRVQLEPQDSAKTLRDFQRRNGGGAFVIEATRDGKAIAAALRKIDPAIKITEVPPIGDKFVRAQPGASAWNDEPGRVGLPADVEKHPWVVPLLAEFRLFTGHGDKHDDQVDAFSQGWNHAVASAGRASASSSSLGEY